MAPNNSSIARNAGMWGGEVSRICAAVAITLSACPALAQRNATVQLPSFQQFSVQTVVSVLDRGGAYLGGVNRSRQRSASRGLPMLPRNSRAYSGGASRSGVSVHAQIIDLQEMDQQVMQQWAQIKPRDGRGHANAIAKVPAKTVIKPTIRELRQRQAAKNQAQQQQASRDFQAGWTSEQQGKLGIARIYYRMALKASSGELRDRVQSRLSLLSTSTVAAK